MQSKIVKSGKARDHVKWNNGLRCWQLNNTNASALRVVVEEEEHEQVEENKQWQKAGDYVLKYRVKNKPFS